MNPSSIRTAGIPIIGGGPKPPAPAAPTPGASGEAPAAGGPVVIDVTEESFQVDVVERSMHTPVVLDFWADWCEPCKQLSPVLEGFAAADGGAWVLAKIDVDANPRLAEAAQVQGIPAVKAIIKGQVVDLFTGAAAPAQVRSVLDQLMTIAQEQGLSGQPPTGEPGPPPLDADLVRGDDAFAAGDLEAAEAGYNALLSREPGNLDALSSLARVALVRRTTDLDDSELSAPLPADPASLDSVLRAADIYVLTDRLAEGFALLIDTVRLSAGAERDAARGRLLELFLLIGDQDERVVTARRNLASALF